MLENATRITMTCDDSDKLGRKQEKSPRSKVWVAYKVASNAFARLHLYVKCLSDNDIPRGGFESDRDLPSVPLGVSVARPVGRLVHAEDQDGWIKPLISVWN